MMAIKIAKECSILDNSKFCLFDFLLGQTIAILQKFERKLNRKPDNDGKNCLKMKLVAKK